MKTIAILGAGSWGTAVAIHIARSGNRVLLWGHNPEHILSMKNKGCNERYLPNVAFPPLLEPNADLQSCLQKADHIIIAVPSHSFASVLGHIPKPESGISWITKGVDPDSHKLLSQLVADKWGVSYPVTVISGPSFAKEVALGLPTALTVASNNPDCQHLIRSLLHHNAMRVYLSTDLIGVQLCGAVKNVLAIACGISDGLGYGANAKAALVTRGLAEMSRLGKKMGAKEDTFLGLAGVGDLVLTCTDNQSRNRRFGLLLGQGIALDEAEQEIGQVVEGKFNASQVCKLAEQYKVELPICHQVEQLLRGKISPKEAVNNLLSRSPRDE